MYTAFPQIGKEDIPLKPEIKFAWQNYGQEHCGNLW